MQAFTIPDRSIRICADRGGTFCDLHLQLVKDKDYDVRVAMARAVATFAASDSRVITTK